MESFIPDKNFIPNEIWNFISLLLTILFSFIITRYFLFIPKLKYNVTILPLLRQYNVNQQIKESLKIFYDNKQVSTLSIAEILIQNCGWGTAENFSAPVTIISNANILSAYLDSESVNLKIVPNEISVSRNNIEFMPDYINKGEKIVLRAVLEMTDNVDIKVIGRCRGCKNIKKVISFDKINIILELLTIILIASTFAISHYYSLRISSLEERLNNILIKTGEIYKNTSNIDISENGNEKNP